MLTFASILLFCMSVRASAQPPFVATGHTNALCQAYPSFYVSPTVSICGSDGTQISEFVHLFQQLSIYSYVSLGRFHQ